MNPEEPAAPPIEQPKNEPLSKEHLEKQKLAAEIANLRRSWIPTAVQSGGLLIAVIALGVNSFTASYDRRQAVIDRDKAALELKLTSADLETAKKSLSQTQSALNGKQFELDEALAGLKLALEKTVEANSPAMQEWAKREYSREAILSTGKEHIQTISEPKLPAQIRDHCIRGLNGCIEIYPDIKDSLIKFSKTLNVDPTVWLEPKYSTTEEESTDFVLNLAAEKLKNNRERQKAGAAGKAPHQ